MSAGYSCMSWSLVRAALGWIGLYAREIVDLSSDPAAASTEFLISFSPRPLRAFTDLELAGMIRESFLEHVEVRKIERARDRVRCTVFIRLNEVKK